MSYRLLLLLFVLLNLTSFCFATEPPKDPILRIDTGAHSSPILSISADALGKTVLTCSEDKTARLYDIESGQLLKTFRPPLAVGSEGMLYAGALSPDGGLAAVGGLTTLGSERGYTIYLFDTASGALTRHISGLPDVIHCLSFSADGQSLAASLAGKNGIRLFRVSDGQEIARDSDYGSMSNSVHFAPDGRVVSTSGDGYLRLYDCTLTLQKKIKPLFADRLGTAQFSPDGSRIAVGYMDHAKVDVFSGTSLKYLICVDTIGLTDTLPNVAWSADGQTLYAAGNHAERVKNTQQIVVVSWSDQGRGKRQKHIVNTTNSLMDLFPLGDGTILFGSAILLWVSCFPTAAVDC